MKPHKFNLIENAADSLVHALEHIGPVEKGGISDWKRVIRDLAHVIELLFKERLRAVHPAFVYADVDKYPSANPLTVSSERALKRLTSIANVSLSEQDAKFVEQIRKKRNEIEHFEFTITDKEGRILVGHTLSFILEFAFSELSLNWHDEHLDHGKWDVLKEYAEYYQRHLAKVEAQIKREETFVFNCPSCQNKTFGVEQAKCMLCNYEEGVLECNCCKEPYLYSDVEYEDAGLCRKCEYEDGYAAHNFEKY